jgi:carboxypeptidase D
MPDVCNCEALANSVLIGGGLQGFQKPIAQDSFLVDGIGALGNMQSERNLTYVEVVLSGHT